MSEPLSPDWDAVLWTLFQTLRRAGMQLSLPQYQLLQQAIDQGYGLAGIADLRQVCQLLWVKPIAGCDLEVFNSGFDQFVRILQAQTQPLSAARPTPVPDTETAASVPANLSAIPHRVPGTSQTRGVRQALTAVKTQGPSPRTRQTGQPFCVVPRQLPLTTRSVQRLWQTLQRSHPTESSYELDLEATIEQINRQGVFQDVVLRPVQTHQTELLLLVDDSNMMIPFRHALQPLIDSVMEHRIAPAKVYRFTTFPNEYLYAWQQPTQAVALQRVLSQLHTAYTEVVIVSDAGAAARTYNTARIKGSIAFLQRLAPCVRHVLWLNPLPAKRWSQTSAQAIADFLKGRMIAL